MQLLENRLVEYEKVLKTRAPHDPYIRNKLRDLHLNEEKPKKKITNIVKENDALKNELNMLRDEVKQMKSLMDAYKGNFDNFNSSADISALGRNPSIYVADSILKDKSFLPEDELQEKMEKKLREMQKKNNMLK